MQRAPYAFLLLILCLANGCRPDEDQPVLPDASVTAALKKKVLVANDNPSQVFNETEYRYGPDQRLFKTETYSFGDNQRVMREYTEYAYDTEGRQVRSANYVLHSSGDFQLFSETVFAYADGLLVRETATYPAQVSSAIAYEYAEERLVKKSFVDDKNTAFRYLIFEYDGAGKLTGETNFNHLDKPTEFARYAYRNGLRVEKQTFINGLTGSKPELWSTIRYAYDAKNRLVFEKTEYISPLSSAIFPSIKYEYY
jgi:hypothetical protein